jgi:predicted ribonuclease YlaK
MIAHQKIPEKTLAKKRTRKQKVEENQEKNILKIKPKNIHQETAINSIYKNTLTVLNGSAGTGKTLLGIFGLYTLLEKKEIDKILVVRLITETCEEKLGALPGEKDEKMLPFALPIIDNLSRFLPLSKIEYLFSKKIIEVIPVSHCRGRSLNYTGILIEEAQNLSPKMIHTILTRIDNVKYYSNKNF